MSTVTYKDCVWTLARNAGRNPNPAADPDGKSNVTNLDRDQWTSYLNDAIVKAWDYDPFFIWPWTAAVVTPTVTGNTFPYSSIFYSAYWTAWVTDPRTNFLNNSNTYPYTQQFPERLRLGSALDVDGATILLHPQNRDYSASVGPVMVFYRTIPPQWNWTPVVTTTTYNTIGTLVYAGDTDGNVYKSIATGALGSALTDATKWTPQTIPSQLREMILADAERRRLLAQNSAQSEQALTECERDLDDKTQRTLANAEQTLKASPWLRRSYDDPNQYTGYYNG